MNNTLTLYDESGKRKDYAVVATFRRDETNFIVFTDKNDIGDLMVLKYNDNLKKSDLRPIDEEDKEFVENYLNTNLLWEV